jgi:hypothetical protein
MIADTQLITGSTGRQITSVLLDKLHSAFKCSSFHKLGLDDVNKLWTLSHCEECWRSEIAAGNVLETRLPELLLRLCEIQDIVHDLNPVQMQFMDL